MPYMTKPYAEYRLKLLAAHYPGISISIPPESSVLFRHHEEVEGRFVPTDQWQFVVSIDSPGCRFTNHSQPFSLGISKHDLDKIFLETLNTTVKTVWDNARLNMPEGE
jgi:hypothetical protein